MVVTPLGSKTSPETRASVVACCGAMVYVSGMERMTFEILRVLGRGGARVHCVVNTWENERIRKLVDEVGATWSTGYYWYRLDRHTRNPLKIIGFVWDVTMTSLGLLRDAFRVRATAVLVPEFVSAIRNAPALLLLRLLGKRVVVRLPNHPAEGRFYRALWTHVLPTLASVFVQISEFSAERAVAAGLPASKIKVIKNCVPRRGFESTGSDADADADADSDSDSDSDPELVELLRSRRTLLAIGQIAPFKGTHLALEATISLLRDGWDLQLAVVGRRPHWPEDLVYYYDSLRARAQASGFADRIHFTGEREDVPALLRAGYLFVAPILQEETFGTALLEAKHAGLPVVAFPHGGIPEQVEHRVTGYLCERPDIDGLAEGIRYFLKSPRERDRASEASLRFFEDPDCEHRPDVFAQKWLDVLDVA